MDLNLSKISKGDIVAMALWIQLAESSGFKNIGRANKKTYMRAVNVLSKQNSYAMTDCGNYRQDPMGFELMSHVAGLIASGNLIVIDDPDNELSTYDDDDMVESLGFETRIDYVVDWWNKNNGKTTKYVVVDINRYDVFVGYNHKSFKNSVDNWSPESCWTELNEPYSINESKKAGRFNKKSVVKTRFNESKNSGRYKQVFHGDNHGTTKILSKNMNLGGFNLLGIGIYFGSLDTAMKYGKHVVSTYIDKTKFKPATDSVNDVIGTAQIIKILRSLLEHDPTEFYYWATDYVFVEDDIDSLRRNVVNIAKMVRDGEVRNFQIELCESFGVDALVKAWNKHTDVHGFYDVSANKRSGFYTIIKTDFYKLEPVILS